MSKPGLIIILLFGLCLPQYAMSQDAQSCLDQGLRYVHEFQYDRAIAYYRQALVYRPDFADAYFNLGKCYIMKSNYIKAMYNYRKVMQYEKKYTGDALNSTGLCYELLGDFAKADECYKKGISFFDRDSSASEKLVKLYIITGQVSLELKKPIAALKYFDMALALDPGNGKALNNKGFVIESQGNYGKAIKIFERAVSSGVDSDVAYFNLGIAYGKTGDKVKEAENFGKSAGLGNTAAQRWIEKNAKK